MSNMAIWAMEIQVLEYKTSKTLANKSMISMEDTLREIINNFMNERGN